MPRTQSAFSRLTFPTATATATATAAARTTRPRNAALNRSTARAVTLALAAAVPFLLVAPLNVTRAQDAPQTIGQTGPDTPHTPKSCADAAVDQFDDCIKNKPYTYEQCLATLDFLLDDKDGCRQFPGYIGFPDK